MRIDGRPCQEEKKNTLILVLFADAFDSFISVFNTYHFNKETDRPSYKFGNLTSIKSGINNRDK